MLRRQKKSSILYIELKSHILLEKNIADDKTKKDPDDSHQVYPGSVSKTNKNLRLKQAVTVNFLILGCIFG